MRRLHNYHLEDVAEQMTYLAGYLVAGSPMRVPRRRPAVDMDGIENGYTYDDWNADAGTAVKDDIAWRLLRMVRLGAPEVTKNLHATDVREIYTDLWADIWAPDDLDIAGRVEAVVRADYRRILTTCLVTGHDIHQDHLAAEYAAALLERIPKAMGPLEAPQTIRGDARLYADDLHDAAWAGLPVSVKKKFYRLTYQLPLRQFTTDASIAVELHDWMDEAPHRTTPDMLAAWQAVDTSHIDDALTRA